MILSSSITDKTLLSLNFNGSRPISVPNTWRSSISLTVARTVSTNQEHYRTCQSDFDDIRRDGESDDQGNIWIRLFFFHLTLFRDLIDESHEIVRANDARFRQVSERTWRDPMREKDIDSDWRHEDFRQVYSDIRGYEKMQTTLMNDPIEIFEMSRTTQSLILNIASSNLTSSLTTNLMKYFCSLTTGKWSSTFFFDKLAYRQSLTWGIPDDSIFCRSDCADDNLDTGVIELRERSRMHPYYSKRHVVVEFDSRAADYRTSSRMTVDTTRRNSEFESNTMKSLESRKHRNFFYKVVICSPSFHEPKLHVEAIVRRDNTFLP